MTDRGILMSAPMVRALLREIEAPGTGKTHTRRLAWQTPKVAIKVGDGPIEPIMTPTIWQSVKPGDRLYVQEALVRSGGLVQYEADHTTSLHVWRAHWTRDRQPGRFCPREFSRIILMVGATKREPVQDIGEDDCYSEGTLEWADNEGAPRHADGTAAKFPSVRHAYAALWKQLHTKPGDRWEDNPEVVAIVSRPVLANIDATEEAG